MAVPNKTSKEFHFYYVLNIFGVVLGVTADWGAYPAIVQINNRLAAYF